MKLYNPTARLNKRTMWFGLTVYDMNAAFGVFALVSNLLPTSYQFLAFICIPMVLVPIAIIRDSKRDGFFNDVFYFFLTPKLFKTKRIKNKDREVNFE
jgi:hypothetical protein